MLRLGDARMVISSSSAFAHGVRPHPDAVHVSYCHSPLRYLWHERRRAERGLPWAVRPPVRAVLGAVRRWDIRASGRVTAYIANSRLTRQRIADFYGREAAVVHPPVEVGRFAREPGPRDYFLLVGEVTGHKRTEVALSAAERAGAHLKVVGGGPDLDRLRRRFARAEFLGRVDDRRLADLYAGCRALVVPGVEEFGITMVEAQAAGRPVVAAGGGGACEIVRDGETGVLVPPGSIDGLAEALREVDWEGFDVPALRASAARFSTAEFRLRFAAEVERILTEASGDVSQAHRPAARAVPITPGGILASSRHRP
jgi:glycosyltransferase involved in cell wall biosynthesis